MQWHTLPTFSNAFPTKMDPVRSALDFVAQPTGPPLVHAAHYCRETQWWRLWPMKIGFCRWEISGFRGTGLRKHHVCNMWKFGTRSCNCNSPLSSQLLSAGRHLEVLQFLDPTREWWHALHGGKFRCSPMQNLYLQNAQVFWSRSSSGVKLPSLFVYLCILIHFSFLLGFQGT